MLGGKTTQRSRVAWEAPVKGILACSEQSRLYHNRNNQGQCWGAKSFADDLVTGRGVVLSRAATTLRSVETKPTIGWFVFFPRFLFSRDARELVLVFHELLFSENAGELVVTFQKVLFSTNAVELGVIFLLCSIYCLVKMLWNLR
jgi:hypothetical protein